MRIVILGAGTGVGKTYFSCCLAGVLAQNHPVLALKPVETGFASSSGGAPPPGSDASLLEQATLHVQHPRPHPLFAYADALSPHLAAERAAKPIDVQAISTWVATAEGAQPQATATLVETPGGAFSPLSATTTSFDLIDALDATRVVLVAADRLGTLHEVRVTAEAMSRRGRAPDCVVLSAPERIDASTGGNAHELTRLGIVDAAFTLPRSSPALHPALLALCASQ